MIIDFILAAFVGIATQSFFMFLMLIICAAVFIRPERPFSSGLVKLALMALGISALFSLFGGGSDCDCDL
ncbi:MAG: hypothetical protein RBR77_04855 [Thauera sp.]|jgi:hypothetical protein|nr:hypothetical protein [Thauera sp.]